MYSKFHTLFSILYDQVYARQCLWSVHSISVSHIESTLFLTFSSTSKLLYISIKTTVTNLADTQRTIISTRSDQWEASAVFFLFLFLNTGRGATWLMEDWIPYVRSFDVLATNCYGESVLHCFLFHGFYFEF